MKAALKAKLLLQSFFFFQIKYCIFYALKMYFKCYSPNFFCDALSTIISNVINMLLYLHKKNKKSRRKVPLAFVHPLFTIVLLNFCFILSHTKQKCNLCLLKALSVLAFENMHYFSSSSLCVWVNVCVCTCWQRFIAHIHTPLVFSVASWNAWALIFRFMLDLHTFINSVGSAASTQGA